MAEEEGRKDDKQGGGEVNFVEYTAYVKIVQFFSRTKMLDAAATVHLWARTCSWRVEEGTTKKEIEGKQKGYQALRS